jgi:hypothetical protein
MERLVFTRTADSTLTSDRITIDDWLLTEAVRHQEEALGRRHDDAAANALAAGSRASRDQKLLARARALPGSDEVRADIARLRRLVRTLGIGLLGLGVLSGLLAARAGMRERQIDILLSTVTLVGLPTVMLVLWLILLLATRRRGGSTGIVGELLVAGLVRLAPRLLRSGLNRELILSGIDLARSGTGRAYLSALSHGFWLSFSLAASIVLFVYFSFVQYDLSWGTTILDEATVVAIIQGLAGLPAALGIIPAPEAEWIAAGRQGELLGSDRAIWARLMLAMVLMYAAAPRALLAIVCLVIARRTGNALAFDRDRPGYLRLMLLLQSEPTGATVHGSRPAHRPPRPPRSRPRSVGPPVVVGVELDRGPEHWPPKLPELDARPLGQVDGRAERREVLAALSGLQMPPAALIAVCSLLRTPDAGTEALLNELADEAGSLLILILDQRDPLERRGGDVEGRVADWEDLARRCGGQAITLDTRAPDRAALDRLKTLIERSDVD